MQNGCFFATSHRKSQCDGIGGTVKRATAKTSLHRPLSNQILDTEKMYDFCVTYFENIKFILIKSEQMENLRKEISPRFNNLSTIPGTRSFHHFVPVGDNKLSMKRSSDQADYTMTYSLFGEKENVAVDLRVAQYIVCVYDTHWWVGTIESINVEENDIDVKFMHPHGPSRSFNWPTREDCCIVPRSHVLCTIGIPITGTGRQYKISEDDLTKAIQIYNDLK